MGWYGASPEVQLCGVSTRTLVALLSHIKSFPLNVRNARSEVLTLPAETCYNPPQHYHSGGDPMALTLADANQMIQAAITQEEALQVKLSIAVCDTGGNLIAFSRMNGAS